MTIESTNGYAAKDAAWIRLPLCITLLGPSRSTSRPTYGTNGVTARLATVITRPSWTRVRSVWRRK